ncbi:MAG: hypothetical protein J7M24_01470 [Candidatus Latescibacteria bacterium]|nr:hypothetical protein [Candidatus Latescibacterota bacterium]
MKKRTFRAGRSRERKADDRGFGYRVRARRAVNESMRTKPLLRIDGDAVNPAHFYDG